MLCAPCTRNVSCTWSGALNGRSRFKFLHFCDQYWKYNTSGLKWKKLALENVPYDLKYIDRNTNNTLWMNNGSWLIPKLLNSSEHYDFYGPVLSHVTLTGNFDHDRNSKPKAKTVLSHCHRNREPRRCSKPTSSNSYNILDILRVIHPRDNQST